ncbi:MAG TPA: hypoxanthine-guanine phosphoribosyltransferase [Gammaproteobacteria bacterium]
MLTLSEANEIMQSADCIYTAEEVEAVLDRLAAEIKRDYETLNPLVLSVMNGGLFVTAALLRRLQFPMQCDYLQASRYHGATSGGTVEWLVKPRTSLTGRHVLIMDDILDEGVTLREILFYCRQQGAASVEAVALTRKRHKRLEAGVQVKYVGLDLPDRYVFGCGMDYKNYFRNLNAIYALPEEKYAK